MPVAKTAPVAGPLGRTKIKERAYTDVVPLTVKIPMFHLYGDQLIRHQHVAIYLATTLCPRDNGAEKLRNYFG